MKEMLKRAVGYEANMAALISECYVAISCDARIVYKECALRYWIERRFVKCVASAGWMDLDTEVRKRTFVACVKY
jgi:hypothetical protein